MSTTSTVIRRDEPFTCLICGRAFSDRQMLLSHKDRDHGVSTRLPLDSIIPTRCEFWQVFYQLNWLLYKIG